MVLDPRERLRVPRNRSGRNVGVGASITPSPMFQRPPSRSSARQPSSRLPAGSQAITPAAPDSAVLRFQTLEDVDARFADFLDYAEFVLGHSADSRRGYKGTYSNFRRYLRSRANVPLPSRLCDIEGWITWNRKRDGKKPLSSVTLNTYY